MAHGRALAEKGGILPEAGGRASLTQADVSARFARSPLMLLAKRCGAPVPIV
jgi:hypothetical protein